jgi:hypothetical protein
MKQNDLPQAGVTPLPAPSIDQAKNGKLALSDCPYGANVRVSASIGFQIGDQLAVFWDGLEGVGTTRKNHTVKSNPGEDVVVVFPYPTVEADVGQTVTIHYLIMRVGTLTNEPSLSADYEVTTA